METMIDQRRGFVAGSTLILIITSGFLPDFAMPHQRLKVTCRA
jgi:hypothetical protein